MKKYEESRPITMLTIFKNKNDSTNNFSRKEMVTILNIIRGNYGAENILKLQT